MSPSLTGRLQIYPLNLQKRYSYDTHFLEEKEDKLGDILIIYQTVAAAAVAAVGIFVHIRARSGNAFVRRSRALVRRPHRP